MKVRIKAWTAVATWRWDLPEGELCGICQQEFDQACDSCIYPGDSCGLINGTCNHWFHTHCIDKWLNQEAQEARVGNCPLCRQPWTIKTATAPSTRPASTPAAHQD